MDYCQTPDFPRPPGPSIEAIRNGSMFRYWLIIWLVRWLYPDIRDNQISRVSLRWASNQILDSFWDNPCSVSNISWGSFTASQDLSTVNTLSLNADLKRRVSSVWGLLGPDSSTGGGGRGPVSSLDL